MRMKRRYSELITLPTFRERYNYVKLNGKVGEDTFGADRYLNQLFYKTKEWRQFRNEIIFRDRNCDLAHPDYELLETIVIHHLNPITKEDILDRSELLMDPENVICTAPKTHQAIHYGDASLLILEPLVRRPNDTCPWR